MPMKSSPLLNRVKRSPVETIKKEEITPSGRHKAEEIRAKNTLSATGPGMVIESLGEGSPRKVQPEHLMPHDHDKHTDWVSLPAEHAGSWGAIRVAQHPLREALRLSLESIYYEAKEMQILNLSRHVEEVYHSCKNFLEPDTNEDTIRHQIREALSSSIRSDSRFQNLVKSQTDGTLLLQAHSPAIVHHK